MLEKKALHLLNSGMVLDRILFAELPAPEMSTVISTIRAANGKELLVVDGAENCTPQLLVSMLVAKDNRFPIVNELLGGFFTAQQIDLLSGNANIKPAAVGNDLIVNLGGGAGGQVAAIAAEQPAGYQFQPIPAGWSISGYMSLGPTKIKRKIKNSDGDGTLFAMSPQDYEKLWFFASKAWAGIDGAPLQGTFSTNQGKLKATVQDDRIALGGNYIRRYEIEQIAKYRGWALPGVAIAA